MMTGGGDLSSKKRETTTSAKSAETTIAAPIIVAWKNGKIPIAIGSFDGWMIGIAMPARIISGEWKNGTTINVGAFF